MSLFFFSSFCSSLYLSSLWLLLVLWRPRGFELSVDESNRSAFLEPGVLQPLTAAAHVQRADSYSLYTSSLTSALRYIIVIQLAHSANE